MNGYGDCYRWVVPQAGRRGPSAGIKSPNRYSRPDPKPDYSDASDAIDRRVVEAYEIQKRFVTEEVYRSPYVWGPNIDVWVQAGMPNVDKWIFSPAAETRIARNGNYFRTRGWIKFTSDKSLSYVCEMRLDLELDTWKLVGHIEEIK